MTKKELVFFKRLQNILNYQDIDLLIKYQDYLLKFVNNKLNDNKVLEVIK